MNAQRSLSKFKSTVLLSACYALCSCMHEPMAFAELSVENPPKDAVIEVRKEVESYVLSLGLEKLGPDGYSEITGEPGPQDYSSQQYLVSITERSGSFVVAVYEEAPSFTSDGMALISSLGDVIENSVGEQPNIVYKLGEP